MTTADHTPSSDFVQRIDKMQQGIVTGTWPQRMYAANTTPMALFSRALAPRAVPWGPDQRTRAEVIFNNVLSPADIFTIVNYFSDWRSVFDVLLDAVDEATANYRATLSAQRAGDAALRDFLLDRVGDVIMSACFAMGYGPITAVVLASVGERTSNANVLFGVRWATPLMCSMFTNTVLTRVLQRMKHKLAKTPRLRDASFTLRDFRTSVVQVLADAQAECVRDLQGAVDEFRQPAGIDRLLWALHQDASVAKGRAVVDDELLDYAYKYRDALQKDTMEQLKRSFSCPIRVTTARRDDLVAVLEKGLWADFVLHQDTLEGRIDKNRISCVIQARLEALEIIKRRGHTNWAGRDPFGVDARARADEQTSKSGVVHVGAWKMGLPGHMSLLAWAQTFDLDRAISAVLGTPDAGVWRAARFKPQLAATA